MAKLQCPECKFEIKEYNIHDETTVCSRCESDFNTKSGLVGLLDKKHKTKISSNGIVINQQGDQFEMIVLWSSVTKWEVTLFSGILIVLILGGISMIVTMLLKLILLVGIGICLRAIYKSLFLAFNRSYFMIENGFLKSHHRFKNRKTQPIVGLDINNISQVFVRKEYVGKSDAAKFFVYNIFIQCKSGEELLLMGSIDTPEQAYYIETKLEAHLAIEDRILIEEYHPNKKEVSNHTKNQVHTAEILSQLRPVSQDNKKVLDHTCPSCETEISEKNVNSIDRLTYCEDCDESFPFLETAEVVKDLSHKKFDHVPEGVKVFSDKGGLDIEWKTKNIFQVLLLVPLSINLVVMYFFFGWDSFKFFAPPLVIIGALALLIQGLKKDTIRVSNRNLYVDRYPTFFFRTRTTVFKREMIEQIFVMKEIIQNGKSKSTVFNLILVDLDDNRYTLISHNRSSDQLFFIESKIENFLNIDDEKMEGEFEYQAKTTPKDFTEAVNLVREKVARRHEQ